MNPDPFLTDGWRGQEDWEYEEEYAEEYAVCSLEDMLALLQSDDEVLKETVSRDEYVHFNCVHAGWHACPPPEWRRGT